MDTHETKIYNAVLIAAAILGIIVVYFIVTIIRNQRRHLKLEQANLLVEIVTLENERKRIVSDLHDELGPVLSVVKMHIMKLDTRLEEDLENIEQANEKLDNILDRIRDICNQLMPQGLLRKGFIMGINEFIGELEGKTPINMNFKYEDMPIPAKAEIHLYRMIQEIINNAIKHSQATKLDIQLYQKNSKIIITVKDNGKGFSVNQVTKESRGLGLKNILSRVDILQGDLYLASNLTDGTTFTIEIPKD